MSHDFSDVKKPTVEHTPDVRVYGLTVGNGSLQRVVAGITEGLRAVDKLAGVFPTDGYLHEEHFPGAFAEVAVHEGIPRTVTAMSSRGFHKRQYAVLAPNSTWLPAELIELLLKHATLASPSEWGAEILRRYAPADKVCVYRHGISSAFKPSAELRERRLVSYREGSFSVLHMTSSDRERKGTAELIEAWSVLMRHQQLGVAPVLNIVAAGEQQQLHDAVQEWCEPAHRSSVCIIPSLNLPVAEMAELYARHHVVCQPSRGEGFGLVPLEARACGVPVLATAATGHGEHIDPSGEPGVIVVPTGALGPIDDGPDAEAPKLEAAHVGAGLVEAHQLWVELSEQALAHAARVADKWSWQSVTEQWMKVEGIECSS